MTAGRERPVAARRPWRAAAFASLLVGAGGCASTSGSLALPRNWDDHYLDRIADKAGTRTSLAVLPFTVSERVKAAGELRLGDMVTTALSQTGRFDLVEREKLDEILKEQRLGRSGLVDESTAASVGKLAGAQAVVLGVLSSATQQKIDKFSYDLIRTEVRIDARAVDVATGRVTFTEAADGFSEIKVVTDSHGTVISGAVDPQSEYAKAAAHATLVLGEKLGRRFPVVAWVVSVDGDRVLVDAGADKELGPGDRLVVIRPLERIRHPVTGEAIGWKKKVLGLVEVRAVERSTSTAAVIKRGEDGEAMKAGDVAVLRRDPP